MDVSFCVSGVHYVDCLTMSCVLTVQLEDL